MDCEGNNCLLDGLKRIHQRRFDKIVEGGEMPFSRGVMHDIGSYKEYRKLLIDVKDAIKIDGRLVPGIDDMLSTADVLELGAMLGLNINIIEFAPESWEDMTTRIKGRSEDIVDGTMILVGRHGYLIEKIVEG